jgi:dihydrofolate reductase
MRKLTFSVASSLDNYIARENGAVDWLLWSDDAQAVTAAHWKTVDTMLMGRKTYETAVRQGGGGGTPGMQTYVFSRVLDNPAHAGVEVVRGDAVEFVRDLKQRPGRAVSLMGGGELADSLLAAGLVDEIELNIHPVLLGSGVPLFHGASRQIDLELLESRPLQRGCVLLTYRVKP